MQDIGEDDRAQPRQSDDPLEQLVAQETLAIVEDAIATLPPAKAAIARAKFIEGLTIEEIAERFGWSIGSAKTVLSQARAVIAKALERKGISRRNIGR